MKYKRITKNNFFLILLIGIEFMLFCTFAVREVCNMIPSDVDQSVYLNQSYSLYSNIVGADYKSAAMEILNMSNTGLPLLGTVMLFLFGQSRLSMLIPNFVGFAALQVVGYKAVNRNFKSMYAGWGYMGILLLTHTTFGWAANIVSFRADFLFACLFSTWCILLFESVYMGEDKIYYISSVVAGLMLFIRFFAVCFIAPIMLIEIFMFWRSHKKGKETIVRLVKYIGGVLIGGGWLFLINIVNFVKYYLYAMTSDMKEIWQISLSPIENIIYYPKYFLGYHMGKSTSIFLLALGIICVVILKIRKKDSKDKQTRRACLLLILAFIVPYAFLMISNKQPLVISIWNGVFIFAVFFVMGEVYKGYGNQITKYAVGAFSCMFLFLGMINYLANTTGHFYGAYVKYSDKKEIWRMNNEIVNWAAENNKDTVYMILDRWNDVLSRETLKLISMESGEGTETEFLYAIENMNQNFATLQFTEEELQNGLNKADVIVVADAIYNYESAFPTDQLFDGYRDEISRFAEDNLVFLKSFAWRDNKLQVYVKRPVTIGTEWPDWLSVQNSFTFRKEEGDVELVIEGNYMEGLYPELKARSQDKESEEQLNVSIAVKDGRYAIRIDISELTNQEHTIELMFDSFYVPSEISDSADSRQLAVLYPDNCHLRKEKRDD